MFKWILGGIVALIVIDGCAFFVVNNKKTVDQSPVTSTTANNSSSFNKAVATTITYSSSGFGSATTTIKSGDTIAISNTSSVTLKFDSDPHPQHTDDTDLNVGVIASGETESFMVTKTGTFGFHNHLNPSHAVIITVQ